MPVSYFAAWHQFTLAPATSKTDTTRGRRWRAFRHAHALIPNDDPGPLDEAYQRLSAGKHPAFAAIPLTTLIHEDPELHVGLQDLAWLIVWDLHEACAAFDDPDMYYEGVDNGVPDSLVPTVIAAMQRELNRESRGNRPPVPLEKLPWRIQRAVVERRRYRYAQYGITEEVRQKGTWSLWDVPEDTDWLPNWLAQ